MVMFHTHVLLGIVVFLFFKDFFSGGNELIFFFMVLLGSVLPDIDERRSRINRWSGFVGTVIAFFAKHRGFFHSVTLYFILLLVITAYWSNYYAWGLFIGYVAHLIGDGITRMGVPVFYPFSQFKIKGPIKVGGFVESIILVVLAIIIIKQFL